MGKVWAAATIGAVLGGSVATLALACCVAAARADRRNPTRTDDTSGDISEGLYPNHVDEAELRSHMRGSRRDHPSGGY